MTIKRVLEINDKNYNETFEVSSKNGYFEHGSIVIFDEDEVAQKCIEILATYREEDDICYVNKDKLKKYIESIITSLSEQLSNRIIKNAIDNVEDDDEMKWEVE